MEAHSGLGSVGIIGSGTAGLLTALALKERDPRMDVTIVASSGIPVIGVGEATTPVLPPFLFGYLGIDPHRFEREVQPTLKLGIRFEWGLPDGWFNYAFGDGDLSDAMSHDGHLRRYSATSQMMDAGKAPLVRVGGKLHSLLRETRLALHLDNVRLVRFLEQRAREVGVRFVDATVHEVRRASQGPSGDLVDQLETSAGPLSFDLYVDCTGFRSLLMNGALHSPFIDYSSSLMTDRAITAVRRYDAPNGPKTPPPYTTARTMNAGWCWTIPMRDELHHGYVFASKYLKEDDAHRELEKVYPGCDDFKVVRFRSGRREHFIRGNVVALGNSYAFVEPLESTAIHMVVIAISKLLAELGAPSGARASSLPRGPHGETRLSLAETHARGQARPFVSAHRQAELNAQMGAHWDWLRWFLAVHYRFNRRVDSPFWHDVHLTTDWSGLEATHKDFLANGPLSARDPNTPGTPPAPKLAGDIVFGPRGFDIVMLGQGVVPKTLPRRTSATEWRELAIMRERMIELALPHAEALGRFGEDRALLDGLVHD
ncbi:MAG TPA: FAD-dependent oxidoreductase, partial [Myxococcota bacterium]|nr:FAD-dependent oxidoreductase [Myxococcota bacterium]